MTDISNPLAAPRQDTTTWYSGVGIAESIADTKAGIDSGSWVDSTIGGIGTSLEALSVVVDPLGSLVSWGVGWLIEHVKPLSDALDWLAGDPDQITAYMQTWRNVGADAVRTANDLKAAVDREVADWSGATATAYRAHISEHLTAMNGIAEAANCIGSLVEGAGLLVALVRELVRDLIADFVSVLAVRLPMWLAEEGFTFGLATPLVATQVGSLVAKWAAKISKLILAMLNSLRRLTPLIKHLDDLIRSLKDALAKLARRDPSTSHRGWEDSPTRDSHLYHSEDDPLRRHGPASETHPAEWDNAVREADELGVEVSFRTGALAYGPSPSPGSPGRLVLDPDCSYGALIHELNHMRDDRAAGWAGMRGWFEDPMVRYENEVRAYQKEIEYAESIGDQDSVDKLRELIRKEYNEIFGEQP